MAQSENKVWLMRIHAVSVVGVKKGEEGRVA